MSKLTAAKAAAIDTPGLHGDGGGLYLRVAPGGSKSWIHRATIHGRRRDIGLGGFPSVTLARARRAADANRAAIADGLDPLAERQRQTTPTFEAAARAVFAANEPRWKNAKHRQGWIGSLERHAFPTLGRIPLDKIGREDVLAVLVPIWSTTPETARRVRQRVRSVLRWAQAHGYVQHNVAGDMIDGALPSMANKRGHFAAVPYADVAGVLARIDASRRVSMVTRLCLRFLVLTAARSGEARGATWNEIDMDAATWTIPAARMKAGREHRVPLSDAALAVLGEAAKLRDESGLSGLVFPSSRGGPISDNTVSKLFRDYDIEGTPHGLRSSFRDWCAESAQPRELAEAALAHTVPGVEGSYFRSDLYQRRAVLMEQWGQYLSGTESKVVSLRRARHGG